MPFFTAFLLHIVTQDKIYAQNVPDIREYLTAKQVVALYGIERSTLYRLARLRKIPYINLRVRLIRFKRSELALLFHYRRD